jgi:uncharacterized membrane protein YqgA involved in biofilm formation
MKRLGAVKIAAILFVIMSGFVAFQAYWIAQLDLPYLLRSLLAISGGMFMGYAASILLIVWVEADNSLE